jgi:hypothetical protein
VTIALIHKVAVFLNPKQRSMKCLNPEERTEVMEYVNTWIERYSTAKADDEMHEQPRKRMRMDQDEFDDDENEELPTTETEVDVYKRMSLPQQEITILDWWASVTVELPVLSQMARHVLSVSATSAPSERNFSLAGHTVSSRRSCLSASSVNSILFLNSAYRC